MPPPVGGFEVVCAGSDYYYASAANKKRRGALCFPVVCPDSRSSVRQSVVGPYFAWREYGYQWNLAQIFFTWVGIAEKVF